MAWSALPTDARRYVGIAALLTIAYAIVAASLCVGRDFDDRGPLSYHAPGTGSTPAGILTAEGALEECFVIPTTEHRVIAGKVREGWYYACYETSDTGSISVKVLDDRAAPVTDVAILKEAGVWPRVGVITAGDELVIGFIVMAAMPVFGWRYYRKARPGPAPRFGRRWWQHPLHPSVAWGLALLPIALAAGLSVKREVVTSVERSVERSVVASVERVFVAPGPVALALPLLHLVVFLLLPSISRARKIRVIMQVMLALTGIFVAGMLTMAVRVKDPWGIPVIGLLMAGFLLCTFGGWRWLAHSDFDYPDRPPASRTRRLPWPAAPIPQSASVSSQPAPRYPLPAPPIPTPPPPSPPPADVAIREFRAWAKFRNITSRVIRGVAITLAVTLIFTGFVGVLTGFGLASSLVSIFSVYGLYFIVPGVVAALLSLPLILGWRDPPRILVLRPFNRADHSRSLRGLVRRDVAGYGHVYTFADTAIKIRWYVTIPVVLGQLGFLSFRLRQIRGPRELEQLAHVLIKVRRRNLNWAVARSKLFAARCTDTVWQQAVTHVARTCDAVLIDVTDLTKGLAWELELLQGLGRLDDCIFLALHGFEASAQAMLTQQLGRTVPLLVYDRAGRLIAPREFRNALAAIIFQTTGRSADLITGPDPAGGAG